MFAVQIKNMHLSIQKCLKSQHRAISPQTSGKLKDIHFNTGKHTAHAQHLILQSNIFQNMYHWAKATEMCQDTTSAVELEGAGTTVERAAQHILFKGMSTTTTSL